MQSRWTFFKTNDKPPISAEEVAYWRTMLAKILKVGIEFEFNLPNPKGFCKGISKTCPCKLLGTNAECWKTCLNESFCRETYKDEFETNCAKEFCTNHTSRCLNCPDYQIDCVDCMYRLDAANDPEGIRSQLKDKFKPSGSYGQINASGVHSVVTDGSLLGGKGKDKGVEVITVGRRIDYWEFFNMIKSIVTESMQKGAYVNERCSTHVHLLASYYNVSEGRGMNGVSELERPLPQIILANLHQLLRRYQNALTWMTMGLDKREKLTRWETYRVSILDVSPVTSSMRKVMSTMEKLSNKAGGKYGWVNYMYSSFNPSEDVTRLHVEMRVMDGMLSTSVVTAMACLFYSLFIKAVEISKYGLLEIGPKEWMDKTNEIKSHMMNNISGWNDGNRFSDTRYLTDEDMQVLTDESEDLLAQVKHVLFKLGPAYEVLEKLARKPVAFYRCEGMSWEDIEKVFEVYQPVETVIDHKLTSILDFRTFTGCKGEDEWIEKACEALVKEGIDNKAQITEAIDAYKKNGLCIWSNSLGTYLKV